MKSYLSLVYLEGLFPKQNAKWRMDLFYAPFVIQIEAECHREKSERTFTWITPCK